MNRREIIAIASALLVVACLALFTFVTYRPSHMETTGEMMERIESELNEQCGDVYQLHHLNKLWTGEVLGDEFASWRVEDGELIQYRIRRVNSPNPRTAAAR